MLKRVRFERHSREPGGLSPRLVEGLSAAKRPVP